MMWINKDNKQYLVINFFNNNKNNKILKKIK